METFSSGDNAGRYYERTKLGSSKKWPSPFRQGPRSSISASDALVLQEATGPTLRSKFVLICHLEQAMKSAAIDSTTPVENTAETATAEAPKVANSDSVYLTNNTVSMLYLSSLFCRSNKRKEIHHLRHNVVGV